MGDNHSKTKITGYVSQIVPNYSDGQFKDHFRLSRTKVEVKINIFYMYVIQMCLLYYISPLQTNKVITCYIYNVCVLGSRKFSYWS